MAPTKGPVVFRLLLLSSFSTIHVCQNLSTTKDIQDMPVQCAVCTKCANGVDAIWGMNDKRLYSKNSSGDIKNCTKASLLDNFPCWHNGTIILPTNDTYQTYHFEVNNTSIEVKPTDCPSLDLTAIVTPDPHRDSINTFRTTPSPRGTNGSLIGGCVAGGAILILIVVIVFIYKKRTRSRPEYCYSYAAGRTQVTTHDDSQL